MEHVLMKVASGFVLVLCGAVILLPTALPELAFGLRVHGSLCIILPGAALVLAGLRSPRAGRAATAFGMVVLSTGTVLAYQGWTQHYESWAYGWILVGPTATGAGWWLHGTVHGDPKVRREGRTVAQIGLAALAVSAVLFELVLGISGYGIRPWEYWGAIGGAVLIVAGLVMLARPVAARIAGTAVPGAGIPSDQPPRRVQRAAPVRRQ